MDTTRIHDDTLDAHYSGLERLRPHPSTEESPHVCYDGLVFIGHLVADEDGEEVEVIEAVPCRRCAEVL
jgi:hypothetical protein